MMIVAGETMRVRVAKITPFGAFVESSLGRQLLHLPMMSWALPFTPHVQLDVGQEIEVVALTSGADPNMVGISLRDRHLPGDLCHLRVGDRLQGRVRTIKRGRHIVEIRPHVVVDLDITGISGPTAPRVDDVVELVVKYAMHSNWPAAQAADHPYWPLTVELAGRPMR